MIFSSHSSSVPLFHPLESGTVEQDHDSWNIQWNTNEKTSLKALANKVLKRNKTWDKPGTNPSKSVPLGDQNAPLCGTRLETEHTPRYAGLSYAFEERVAIAEYDGQQTPLQAERIAYLDAFLSILFDGTELDSQRKWLIQRVQTALNILETNLTN